MTNGNSAELARLLEDTRDYVSAFTDDRDDGHIAESLLAQIDLALSVCADGGKGEAVAWLYERDIDGSNHARYVTMLAPEEPERIARAGFTVTPLAPQAIGKGEGEAVPLGYIHYEALDDLKEGGYVNLWPKEGVLYRIPVYAAAPQAECAPLPKQEPLGEPFQTVLDENRWNLYAECAPREAQPEPESACNPADICAGCRCEYSQSAAPTPEHAQESPKEAMERLTKEHAQKTVLERGIERAQESAGVRLTDERISEIFWSMQDNEGYVEFARAILAATKEPQP